MRIMSGASAPIMECKYNSGTFTGTQWYGPAALFCKPGYSPRWPGVCVKRYEVPAPPSSSAACPGHAVGNPVRLASGSKVQTETDLVGSRSGLLKVTRAYRSLRRSGAAQSASYGWSFSFDREFIVGPPRAASGVLGVSGSFGDGSAFEINPRLNGQLVSRYDKGQRLTAPGTGSDAWLLTNMQGQVERYKKIKDVYRMVSSHGATGESAGSRAPRGPT